MFKRTLQKVLHLQAHYLPQCTKQSILTFSSPYVLSSFSTSRGPTDHKKSTPEKSKQDTKHAISKTTLQMLQQQQKAAKPVIPSAKAPSKPKEKMIQHKPTYQKEFYDKNPLKSLHLKATESQGAQESQLQVKEEIVQQQEKVLRTEQEEDEAQNLKLDLPWDFQGIIMKQPEGNLLAAMDIKKLLSYRVAVGLFKDYVQALQEFDIERLEELLEYSFWERCAHNLKKMKKKGYKFEVEGLNTKKKHQVDLFKVTNMYTVGVHTNRKMNDGMNNYMIFDNFIDRNPTKNIIRKVRTPGEKAVVKVILDIMMETPVKMKLFDGKGEVVSESDKQREIDYHHIKIENDIMEVEFEILKKAIGQRGEPDEEDLKYFQNVFSQDTWKIIDFDNYMKGNDIVKPRVIIF